MMGQFVSDKTMNYPPALSKHSPYQSVPHSPPHEESLKSAPLSLQATSSTAPVAPPPPPPPSDSVRLGAPTLSSSDKYYTPNAFRKKSEKFVTHFNKQSPPDSPSLPNSSLYGAKKNEFSHEKTSFANRINMNLISSQSALPHSPQASVPTSPPIHNQAIHTQAKKHSQPYTTHGNQQLSPQTPLAHPSRPSHSNTHSNHSLPTHTNKSKRRTVPTKNSKHPGHETKYNKNLENMRRNSQSTPSYERYSILKNTARSIPPTKSHLTSHRRLMEINDNQLRGHDFENTSGSDASKLSKHLTDHDSLPTNFALNYVEGSSKTQSSELNGGKRHLSIPIEKRTNQIKTSRTLSQRPLFSQLFPYGPTVIIPHSSLTFSNMSPYDKKKFTKSPNAEEMHKVSDGYPSYVSMGANMHLNPSAQAHVIKGNIMQNCIYSYPQFENRKIKNVPVGNTVKTEGKTEKLIQTQVPCITRWKFKNKPLICDKSVGNQISESKYSNHKFAMFEPDSLSNSRPPSPPLSSISIPVVVSDCSRKSSASSSPVPSYTSPLLKPVDTVVLETAIPYPQSMPLQETNLKNHLEVDPLFDRTLQPHVHEISQELLQSPASSNEYKIPYVITNRKYSRTDMLYLFKQRFGKQYSDAMAAVKLKERGKYGFDKRSEASKDNKQEINLKDLNFANLRSKSDRCSFHPVHNILGKNKKDAVLRDLNSNLNKLSVDNFPAVVEKIAKRCENIMSVDVVQAFVHLFHKKTVSETDYLEMYGDMCLVLCYRSVTSLGAFQKFRTYVIDRCQDEFDRGIMHINTKDEPDPEKLLQKKHALKGGMRFMGILYQRRLWSAKAADALIQLLLEKCRHGTTELSELSIDCLVTLLTQIGNKYEKENNAAFNHLLNELQNFMLSKDSSKSIQYKIQNLMDMRVNNWTSKIFKEKASSVAQIRQDALNDEKLGGSVHAVQAGKFTTHGLIVTQPYFAYLSFQAKLFKQKKDEMSKNKYQKGAQYTASTKYKNQTPPGMTLNDIGTYREDTLEEVDVTKGHLLNLSETSTKMKTAIENVGFEEEEEEEEDTHSLRADSTKLFGNDTMVYLDEPTPVLVDMVVLNEIDLAISEYIHDMISANEFIKILESLGLTPEQLVHQFCCICIQACRSVRVDSETIFFDMCSLCLNVIAKQISSQALIQSFNNFILEAMDDLCSENQCAITLIGRLTGTFLNSFFDEQLGSILFQCPQMESEAGFRKFFNHVYQQLKIGKSGSPLSHELSLRPSLLKIIATAFDESIDTIQSYITS